MTKSIGHVFFIRYYFFVYFECRTSKFWFRFGGKYTFHCSPEWSSAFAILMCVSLRENKCLFLWVCRKVDNLVDNNVMKKSLLIKQILYVWFCRSWTFLDISWQATINLRISFSSGKHIFYDLLLQTTMNI